MVKSLNNKRWIAIRVLMVLLTAVLTLQFTKPSPPTITLKKNAHIVLIGNNLGSRMMNYGSFETEMQLRYPDLNLFIRNMCDGGNTPGFRPHASRVSPWAFPGAEKFQTELAKPSDSQGFFETEDQWLTRLKADVVIAFFGYNESFSGQNGIENYKAELDAFIKHTLKQKYNGISTPQLVIVSPIAFEDLSDLFDLPDGKLENQNLSLYSQAMKEVAENNNVLFADTYAASQSWFKASEKSLTIDGSQLNEDGYTRFGTLLADLIFGKAASKAEVNRKMVNSAVIEKNWMWHNDFKIPNGVHAYGRRYDPFGPDNYPAEIAKLRELTLIRDTAIWMAANGKQMDLVAADKNTTPIPAVKTNYTPAPSESLEYLSGDQAITKIKMAEGFK
ncbi:MAG: dehydrogenase, partial [Pedobacter sp.]